LQNGCAIARQASVQPFATHSTAESELLATATL
jgi:hypothetical protein